jgi:hypothetical protein
MNKFKVFMKLSLDILLFISIILLMLTHFQDQLPSNIQTYIAKLGNLNMFVLYGWGVGRLFIGKVDWEQEKEYTPKIRARLYLWCAIIIAGALGG